MPKALQHEFPRYTGDSDEPREVWHGALRSVSARRARKLRKRGVPLMPLHAVHDVQASTLLGGRRFEPTTPNGRARYAWFECKDDAERRISRRRLQCYMTATQADPNTLGRKAELARRLADQRAYFRKGGKLAATTYFQTFERYAGVPYENVLNPQLDLYAAAFRSMRETEQVATKWGDVPMPAHWTNEQKRHYIQHGYVVEVGHGETDGRVHRRSPPVTLWCAPYESTGPLELGSEPANAGVPTHYEPNEYTRSLLRDATPEQLEAAKAVDMSDFHEGLKRAKLAEWERTRYAKFDGDGRLRVENPLQRATRETMLQAERDGLVQRAVPFARADGGIDEVDPFGRVTPSYAGAPHLDCDCMACRPYTG